MDALHIGSDGDCIEVLAHLACEQTAFQTCVDRFYFRLSAVHLLEYLNTGIAQRRILAEFPCRVIQRILDFAAAELWPVILVCSGKLGALNHALLSIEALKHRDMDLAGVVYNYCAEADPVIDEDTPRMIASAMRQSGYPPELVRLGKRDAAASDDAAQPDFFPIFREALHGLHR